LLDDVPYWAVEDGAGAACWFRDKGLAIGMVRSRPANSEVLVCFLDVYPQGISVAGPRNCQLMTSFEQPGITRLVWFENLNH
jgi:hypothetical protein